MNLDRTEIFKKYQNKWIALSEKDEVISSGDSLKEALEKARKKVLKNQ
jgi:biotin operon repressor